MCEKLSEFRNADIIVISSYQMGKIYRINISFENFPMVSNKSYTFTATVNNLFYLTKVPIFLEFVLKEQTLFILSSAASSLNSDSSLIVLYFFKKNIDLTDLTLRSLFQVLGRALVEAPLRHSWMPGSGA